MNKTKPPSHVPLRIRNACLDGLEQAIPQIVEIAQGGETSALKLSAFDKLARVGLGGRKTVLVEAPQLAEICLEAVHQMFSPTPDQMAALAERMSDAIEALGEDEIEEDDEMESAG